MIKRGNARRAASEMRKATSLGQKIGILFGASGGGWR